MKFRLLVCLLVMTTLLSTLFGCDNKVTKNNIDVTSENKVQVNETVDYITLLYSAGDTFNPYTVKTDINRQICMLLYQPLVSLDNEFNPRYILAKTVKVKGKKCIVTIKKSVFSDGTEITADDVVYSCRLAMKSKNSYSKKLYEVKSVSASNSNTIEFTLNKQDKYFANLLDFPIIKSESDTVADSDSVIQPPIGSGRYKVAKNKQSLVLNSKYSGKKSSIKKIMLINAPDSESVSHYAQIGAADMFYSDISDGEILRISGQKFDVNLNNLVYIGINRNNPTLNIYEIRQALSSGIDRSKICQNSYYNNALAATGFFNPVWSETSAVQNIQITQNKEITIENLEKIGYNRLDSKGIRKNSNGYSLSFSLLVNSENRIRVAAAKAIASQLLEVGIKISVDEKPFKQYRNALKKGKFQLFLGEVKLTDNMDISCLVSEDGSAAFGLYKKKDKDKADNKSEDNKESADNKTPDLSAIAPFEVVKGFYSGKNTITDIAAVLQNDMPFVPVCYRTGVLFCNDNIENINSFSASDIYSSIDSYIINQ